MLFNQIFIFISEKFIFAIANRRNNNEIGGFPVRGIDIYGFN